MEAISVRDPTDVANARRRIGGLTAQLGYDETNAGRVAIVVTELAQNLLRHGGGGEILAGADQQREAGSRSWRWTVVQASPMSPPVCATGIQPEGPAATGWGQSSGWHIRY